MSEKEPQFFKPEKILQETPYKSLEQIEQELREKRVEEEDINAALGMMKRMSFLDRKIFT